MVSFPHPATPARGPGLLKLASVGALCLALPLRSQPAPATYVPPALPPTEGFVLAVETIAAPPPIRSDFNVGMEDWRMLDRARLRTENIRRETLAGGEGRLVQEESRETPLETMLDLVIVFDGTASMRGQIGNVRAAAESMVHTLRASGNVRLGLVRFTDRQAEGAAALNRYPLTSDLESFFGGVAPQIWRTSTGGEDFPEDELWGLDAALGLEWRADPAVARAIVVMSDAPAKLGDGGRDFDGRTVEGVAEAARRQNVRIFPILVDDARHPENREVRHAQANAFAEKTGGRVLPLEGTGSAADAILDVSRNLARLRRGHPRYWRAPPKFLDDQSRHFGTALAFRAGALGAGNGFYAPDIVLVGRPHTLVFQGFLDPLSDRPTRETMETRRVPLDETGDWVHEATGIRATRVELVATLASLRDLLIRADYHERTTRITLDDVVLGDVAEPTDVAVDPRMRERIGQHVQMLRVVRSWRDNLISAEAFEKALRNKLQESGHALPPETIRRSAEAMARLYRVPVGRGFVEVLYDTILRYHETEIRRLRRAGSFDHMPPLTQLRGTRLGEVFLRAERMINDGTRDTVANLVAAEAELLILAKESGGDRSAHERRVAAAKANRERAAGTIGAWRASRMYEDLKKATADIGAGLPGYEEIFR